MFGWSRWLEIFIAFLRLVLHQLGKHQLLGLSASLHESMECHHHHYCIPGACCEELAKLPRLPE